jgi:hypothetical protein
MKRKSMEEKLTAVLEKHLLRESSKERQQQLNELKNQIFFTSNKDSGNPLKMSSSTGDIASAVVLKKLNDEDAKCRSEGSSRNDSLENLSNAETENTREDIAINMINKPENINAAINVSVITSTPIKNSISRTSSRDNIVVITGRLSIIQFHIIIL